MAVAPPGDALADLTRALDARERVLRCYYSVSRILQEAGGSVERVLQETVRVLPEAWEHHDDACARITLRGRAYHSPGFAETPWAQRSPIHVHGDEVGAAEVRYLSRHPSRDDGPFLREEKSLLDAVAQRLGHAVERAEEALRLGAHEAELRKRLLHLTRVTTVGELASSIAHEVNQPLTAISTYAQACRRMIQTGGEDAAQVSHVLGRITDEALRAGEIIHRLKELVRRRESERRRCSVNALILQMAPLAQLDARLHGVALRLSMAPGLPEVMADGVQIQQVVLNLIRNGVDALEALGAGGEVLVETRLADPGEILVAVTDHGCGLPDAVMDELFQPFFTTKADGMGMGLSISRSIVVMHGGRLWYERLQPHGTTFRFTLPSAGGDVDG
jgi:signal transduction histidine kinase